MNSNTHSDEKLLMAMELSNQKWRLGFLTQEKIRHKVVNAGDQTALLREVELAKQKMGLAEGTKVVACYEAGRDGFWIFRWLESKGVECRVVDPSSIEVNRRKRRAKTDRLDTESLVRLLRRYEAGERQVWSVVRVPDPQQEDALRVHREMERLKKEKTAHVCRIRSLLVTQGIRLMGSVSRLGDRLGLIRNWAGHPLPAALRAELEREIQRLAQVEEQIKGLEKSKLAILKKPETLADRQAAALLRLRGVGEVSAWVLAKEFFGWRAFKNRREVGSLSGLTPTPYDSGGSRREQGISKAGNARIRRVMIELAWSWLRFQPDSELTRWFERRFAHGSGRMRRVGITAVARKLLVALWKYVEFGTVPDGAYAQ